MIVHITTHADWESAQVVGEYRHDSLEEEGFIHCSNPDQVLGPANEFFHGRTDLVLLLIDPARLSAELVYEDTHNAGSDFPHIYGPLNLDAVIGVVPFPARSDGSFDLPSLKRIRLD